MDRVIIAVGLLLILFAVWQTVRRFRGRSGSSCCGTAEAVSVKKVSDTDESHYPYRYRLSVDGMMCSNCAANVENSLNAMPGVWGRVNLGRKEADVLAKEPVDEKAFVSALNGTPYAVRNYTVISGGADGNMPAAGAAER